MTPRKTALKQPYINGTLWIGQAACLAQHHENIEIRTRHGRAQHVYDLFSGRKKKAPTSDVLVGAFRAETLLPCEVDMLLAYPDEKSKLHTFDVHNFFLVPFGISRRYTAATALITGVLMRYAGTKSKCWPKLVTIGECLGGIGASSVYTTLKKLVDDDLIRIDHGKLGKDLFTFIWHPYWKECLAEGVEPPKGKDGNELKMGEPFSPHMLFDCGFIHSSVMRTHPSEMGHSEKVILSFMYAKTGANGCTWHLVKDTAEVTGFCTLTAGSALRKLVKRNALKIMGNHSLFGRTYSPVFHKFMMEDMRRIKIEKASKKLLKRLGELDVTEKSASKGATWESAEATASLLSQYNEIACGEEVVALGKDIDSEEDFLEKVQSVYIRERVQLWLSQISTKLPLATRINIAIQLIRGKIKNKGAYAATLIRKAFNGEYVVAGIHETIKTFLRWSGSIARQYG